MINGTWSSEGWHDTQFPNSRLNANACLAVSRPYSAGDLMAQGVGADASFGRAVVATGSRK